MIDGLKPGLGVLLASTLQSGDLSESAPDSVAWPKGFEYMVAAYAAVWLILMVYFWMVARRARQLEERVAGLLEDEAARKTVRA